MTEGKIVNKNTGVEICGVRSNDYCSSGEFSFRIEGTQFSNIFASDDWDFIETKKPKPLPTKNGIYLPYAFVLDEDGDMTGFPNILVRNDGVWFWVGNTFSNKPVQITDPETELDKWRNSIVALVPKTKEESK